MTEFNLLHLLLRHPRQVLERAQILSDVWGYDFGGDDNVLEIYIGYLRKKLEAGGRLPSHPHRARCGLRSARGIMSIRLRFTLLYNFILALTLAIFGVCALFHSGPEHLDLAQKGSEPGRQPICRSSAEDRFAVPTAHPMQNRYTLRHPHLTNSPATRHSKNSPSARLCACWMRCGNLVASPFGRAEDACRSAQRACRRCKPSRTGGKPTLSQGERC